jgi:mRNA interferase MazF
MAALQRGDVVLVNLDPTVGTEIRKTRPCAIVSPDELNEAMSTVIVAPMTTGGHAYPFRVRCRFARKTGFVVVDQVRTIDRKRIVRTLGRLTAPTVREVLSVLTEMFSP